MAAPIRRLSDLRGRVVSQSWQWCTQRIAEDQIRIVHSGKYNIEQRRGQVKSPSNFRMFFWSIAGSGLVNAFLLSSAFAAGAGGKRSLYVRLADMVAAPPGYITDLLFTPKEHSLSALLSGAAVSLACSILFYTLISWLVLRILLPLQSPLAELAESVLSYLHQSG